MRSPRLVLLALAAGLIPAVAPPAAAQSAAGAVPAYEPPPTAEPTPRDGQVMERARKSTTDGGAFAAQSALVAGFADAYARQGRPKLALFWNRQLSDTLTDWYADARLTTRSENSSTLSGELNLNQSGTEQTTVAMERRAIDNRRPALAESFEWEFQDGFLAPFLEAGATVLDRAAIIRLTGIDMDSGNERAVETRALQGKADYLLEILVAANARSTTGYELRARILDVKTGAIVAMVNSKSLKEWNPEKPVLATASGFVEADDDDDSFGPEGDDKYRATAQGFEKRRKPPKLAKISRNLAYNTMTGLMRQWK